MGTRGTDHRISRRRFLGGTGAAGVVVASTRGHALASAAAAVSGESSPVAFHGRHQGGIATPAQSRLLFGVFDVLTDRRADLVALLQEWTDASAQLARGRELGRSTVAMAPPDDTGEATGLSASHLTITFGFGPTLFGRDGVDRFGIVAHRPAPLADLPAFEGDALDPARSGGDLAVQVCADDPQVAFHALRNLTRIGKGTVGLRWSQEGFGRTSSTASDQGTLRNLMGFKDGTNNIRGDDRATMEDHVWVASNDDPAWMRDGTYLVARRIRIRIEVWDRSSLDDQEQTVGRVKSTGAPIGGRRENDTVDLEAKGRGGKPLIAPDAHIRLAAPATNGGAQLLRRGYSFTEGVDPRTAGLDAGLFFLAFMRDPRHQFVPMQQRLAAHDALNEYIQHTGSAIFAVPPGVRSGGWIGETLFT